MNPDLFYFIGGALTLAALVVSAVGLRSKGFPGSRGALMGVLALFVFLVAGTATYAVSLAREEQSHRREEFAKYFEEAEKAGQEELDAAETGGTGPDTGSTAEEAAAGEADSAAEDVETVSMTEYSFGPDSASITSGKTLTAVNDGAIIHNLTVVDGTDELAGTENVDAGKSEDLKVDLEPGDYQMICTVPGHEDLGMSGGFTVK